MNPTDFMHSLQKLAVKIKDRKNRTQTEEATKHYLIIPFIEDVLGYNARNPDQVVPEFQADVANKKGEKVDYAIMNNGKPIMLIECKCCGDDLKDNQYSQLFRYFSTTEAKIGILTNGVEYRIFSDLKKTNRMDLKPFLEFQLSDENQIDKPLAAQILKLSKDHFAIEKIIPSARRLMYESEMSKYLSAQAQEPSQDFVRFLCKQVYDGVKNQSIIEEFTPITQKALARFSSKKIKSRLISLLDENSDASGKEEEPKSDDSQTPQRRQVETTEEELEGYHIIKSMARKWVKADRITYRDNQTYCPIFLDNNSHKTICRLRLGNKFKYLGLIDEHRTETRHLLSSVDDLYNFEEQLRQAILRLEDSVNNDDDTPQDTDEARFSA